MSGNVDVVIHAEIVYAVYQAVRVAQMWQNILRHLREHALHV